MHSFKIRCSAIGQIMSKSGKITQGVETFLKKWYAETEYGYSDQIYSKYFDKGNFKEHDAIDLVAEREGLGILSKNTQSYSNEFLMGTPDVLVDDLVIDVKCPWDAKTFLDSALAPINSDYYWQLQGYMALTNKSSAILAYCLLDTPEDVNYGNEIQYEHLDASMRYKAFKFERNDDEIKAIEDMVQLCREWLNEYDKQVKEALCK